MRAVFVDTSGWLALILRNDQYHKDAAAYYQFLRSNQMPLVTSDYVLDETLTRLRYDAGLQTAITAKDILDKAKESNFLSMQWVDEAVSAKAWELFVRYQDQEISFTDCTSWSICQRLGIEEVFAFDRHFYLMGLTIGPDK
ncbi:MAG: PIN domain-containing protein [Firmicutes bacterium]|nr:PIN domain-containing protein [Bacillota bacterium]